MSSKQKRRAVRQNGAKAAGSKSPQGIQNSAMNALRHGLTSKTLVLANECPEKFKQLLQTYIDKFQPQDGVEMNLVDEMVAARWRQQRVWMVQTAAMDLQMDKQVHEFASSPYPVTEPTRIAMAFLAMANDEKALELLMRYETSYSRMHDRAMKTLMRLRETPLTPESLQQSNPLPQEEPVVQAVELKPPVIPTTCTPTEPEIHKLQNDAKPQASTPPITPFPVHDNPPNEPKNL